MLKTHNYSEKRLRFFFLRMDKIQTFSIAKAIPCPPPMHIVIKPKVPSILSNSCKAFIVKIAPVAPIGCPNAIAPPFGLTFSEFRCNSLETAHA
mgnify:CR=1 FL=1